MPDEMDGIPEPPPVVFKTAEPAERVFTDEELDALIRSDLEKIASNKALLEVSEEELAEVAARAEIDRSTRGEMARKRAQRAGMLRRLQRVYDVLVPFTAAQASERTGRSETVMKSYLELESSIPGSQIAKHAKDGEYVLINPFA